MSPRNAVVRSLDIPNNDWDHILQQLIKTCEKTQISEKWFRPILFVSSTDREIYVRVPSESFRDELQKRYENMINYAKSCTGMDKKLIFLTPEELRSYPQE